MLGDGALSRRLRHTPQAAPGEAGFLLVTALPTAECEAGDGALRATHPAARYSVRFEPLSRPSARGVKAHGASSLHRQSLAYHCVCPRGSCLCGCASGRPVCPAVTPGDGRPLRVFSLGLPISCAQPRRWRTAVGPPIEARNTDSVPLQLVALLLALTRTNGK